MSIKAFCRLPFRYRRKLQAAEIRWAIYPSRGRNVPAAGEFYSNENERPKCQE